MRCHRCHRILTRAPVIVDGKGMGPRCAALEGDLLAQPAKRSVATRRRAPRRDDRQLPLEVQP